jgi:hypothetical protein
MSRLYLPDSEQAFARHVLFAAELIDPVTLSLVSRSVKVAAPPLQRAPLLGFGGRFVWLREGDVWPDRVVVDPAGLPYDRDETAAIPRPPDPGSAPDADLLARVILRPTRDYPFPEGVAVVYGRIDESAAGPPVTDAQVWLQWYDSDLTGWNDSAEPVFTRPDRNGEFAAFLRFAPAARPRIDPAGLMPVRLRVHRPGHAARTGPELLVPQARRFGDFQTVVWSDLGP